MGNKITAKHSKPTSPNIQPSISKMIVHMLIAPYTRHIFCVSQYIYVDVLSSLSSVPFLSFFLSLQVAYEYFVNFQSYYSFSLIYISELLN